MDPLQCYRDLLAAQDAGDHERARELAAALRDWLQKGGFPPQGIPRAQVHRVLAQWLADDPSAGAAP